MSRSDRVSSWVIVAVFVGLWTGLIGFGVNWFGLIDPDSDFRCGDAAEPQLRAAIHEVSSVLPEEAFTIRNDCDSGGRMWAEWETDDLDKMVSDARAFGCRVDQRGFSEDDRELLTCDTSPMRVAFYLDLRTAEGPPVEGSMNPTR